MATPKGLEDRTPSLESGAINSDQCHQPAGPDP